MTQSTLKKHADEAARRQHIATMGIDPAPPVARLKVTPITGNDVFESQAQASVSTVTPPIIDEGVSHTGPFTTLPPSVAPLPHFIPPYFIDDDDFQPDPAEHSHDPPQGSDPPDCYPSMEMTEVDEPEVNGEDEPEDNGEDKPEDNSGVQGEEELDLERFMDWEYLKQGDSHCLRGPYHVRG